ncbi:MFS transporter [Nocardiopsis dassonvillei]|uniref:Major facilitator superfamily MFS_1 n=1 Tax=Nocardiopsis dassonvillei (strain ATCC 23218 / DSM 43111 / CIP 107115 / JCM 7437 / KCTC 9190 / NBRC 14626 / NCTC 10488 / NRRL B-5397 / IMRU 509) TaxID=446468 RepID=D7AV22_NOCDD|nr:MFS transporter [Nocardiopsis dassonvillei]ADH69572.1 major facilitator superfamily MFS_1 [Nocardiopsis dassonvillei subsp. dassonvillei DSM 43111]NKY79088.1 MFS transporter [Nocardiopsis dassonvillei]VEI90082.1 Probable multidrug-efflux transporter Rv1258c/MT1297 [Nocardiopsis dassonvillei]
MRRIAMFRSLANRNYRLYALGQLLSNPGTWMQRIAQDWLVLQLSGGSGIALGMTTALQFLPLLLFGLWGGALVDRLDKRRLLVCTQAAMGVLAVGLGILATAGAAQVWHVYLFAFGLGLITVLDNPGRQAFVPEMVEREHLSNAIALNSASFQLGRVTGPAVAGLLIAVIGSGPVFLINGASFGFTILALMMIRTSELNPAERVARGKGQIREGLRYIGGRRDLVLLLVLAAATQFFGANSQNQIALMVNNVFEAGADAFGVAAAFLAVGALAGALLAARRDRPRLRLVLIGSLAFGALQVVAGLMPGYVPFVLVLVPMGVAFMTYVTTLNATFQLSVDPRMRGRVMSMFLLVFMGVAPIGAPVVGLLADTFGPETSLVIGGAVTLVVVAVISALLFRAKGVRPRDVLPGRRPSSDAETAEEATAEEETAETGSEREEAPEAERERVDAERLPDGSTRVRLVPDGDGTRPDTVTRT